jgi:hypothetical protein
MKHLSLFSNDPGIDTKQICFPFVIGLVRTDGEPTMSKLWEVEG